MTDERRKEIKDILASRDKKAISGIKKDELVEVLSTGNILNKITDSIKNGEVGFYPGIMIAKARANGDFKSAFSIKHIKECTKIGKELDVLYIQYDALVDKYDARSDLIDEYRERDDLSDSEQVIYDQLADEITQILIDADDLAVKIDEVKESYGI